MTRYCWLIAYGVATGLIALQWLQAIAGGNREILELGSRIEQLQLPLRTSRTLSHDATPGHVFYDRSVLDALCMLDHVTPLNESELRLWLSKYQYCRKVFVLPPWKAIYANDAERDHTFEHAESINSTVQEWYRRCRYQLIEVPRVSVAERCRYVLQELLDSNG